MTKRDIIQRCHEKGHDFSKSLTEKVLNFVLEEIALSLSRGERVKLSGFGTWSLRKTKQKGWRQVQAQQKASVLFEHLQLRC
jgi:nucleoid DNA-binding protein